MRIFNAKKIRKDFLLKKVTKQIKIIYPDYRIYDQAWNDAILKVINIIEKSKL